MSRLPDISRLYREGVEFAVYRFPGETDIRVCGSGDTLMVNGWNMSYSQNVAIVPGRAVPDSLQPWAVSTPREQYIASTKELIRGLRRRGGKCVRMRTVCGSCLELDINAAAEALFLRFPDAFCYCLYTQPTGLWLGATPEVLMDIVGNSLHTMSLAGTRHAAGNALWDKKNIDEQQFVTGFICDELKAAGLEPQCGEVRNLRYGDIEHLCTDITAQCVGDVSLSSLLDRLSPTPAVCGQPRDIALAEIARAEDAPRRYYAGYLLLRSADGRVRAYVNLRCAQISSNGWCIYTGGGITADSDAESEWRETEAKASALLEILQNHSL